MPYAEVSVNSPFAQGRTFSYSIPSSLGPEKITVGQAVWVPFGDKVLQGIVLELTSYPSVEETREIAGVIESTPLLSPAHVSLAHWISIYYMSPLFDSVALMLPPGFERRVLTFITRPSDAPEISSSLTPDQKEVVEEIWKKGKIGLKELEKSFGQRRVRKEISYLVNLGLIAKSYQLEKIKIKPRMVAYLRLKVNPDSARTALEDIVKRSAKRAALLEYLIDNPGFNPVPLIKQRVDCSAPIIKGLMDRDLIEYHMSRVDRDPLAGRNVNLSFPLTLIPSQESAFKAICASLQKPRSKPVRPDIFLLHGVTGSGKTEVYLQALEEAVKQGKRGILLVPEIAMTPQIVERFLSRFPGRVAVLHSELSPGEQFDEWWRIKNGEFDVVIGPRSAVFAPQPDLGLIIMDEEHEWTYKQQDNGPRYHTREVALKMAELTGATVVLGSATPDIESYYRASTGEYHLLELPQRVTPGEGSPLPAVEIVDLKKELKDGNLSLFSRSLSRSIETALQKGEQILLFLNRRGAASFVECRNCGWVIRCRRCDIPLSYHFAENILVCHQCNYHIKVPKVCPKCGSQRIKYLGVGTEKLEQETAAAFPRARLLRWDSDAVGGHGHSHQAIFEQFRQGGADILIGTQMIAKGLDLPGVTLVGVISADIALNLPDFRAGERTFQLLSQVAGRAGRGAAEGKVIIQSYSPEHYAVQAAAGHDYRAFYKKELAYRRELNNPPFNRLARLTFTHTSDTRCREEAERMQQQLLAARDAGGIAGLTLIGPAPAFMHRLRGRFRWQIVLRAPNPSALLTNMTFPRGWAVDIDPIGLG